MAKFLNIGSMLKSKKKTESDPDSWYLKLNKDVNLKAGTIINLYKPNEKAPDFVSADLVIKLPDAE